jgi:hypothetical protein
MVRLSASLPLLAVLATAPVLASAYSWKFNSTPKQCGNLELEITGSGGKGPYRALILPTGVNPTQKDFRRVVEIPFNDTSKLSFPLRLPAQGSFVIAVSQTSGILGPQRIVTDDICCEPRSAMPLALVRVVSAQ